VHPTLARILPNGPVVTDGAWGTLLQSMGLQPGECPDAWNLAHPDRVARVAAEYVRAGSRLILTNTFRSNPIALAAHGLDAQTASLNIAGVRASRAAGGPETLVFASVGPTGVVLAAGERSADDVRASFERQTEALAEAGPDGIVVETMGDLDEALLALGAAKRTGLPVVVSMVFDSGRAHDRTMTGVTPETAAQALTAGGADAVGMNCGVGLDNAAELCARLRASTPLPIWVKPNAGLPVMIDGAARYTTTPDDFARAASDILAAGASFIGGCCGTTPGHIAAVVRLPGVHRPTTSGASEHALPSRQL
jgi:methionine synthase I (cobalamin-dependent)